MSRRKVRDAINLLKGSHWTDFCRYSRRGILDLRQPGGEPGELFANSLPQRRDRGPSLFPAARCWQHTSSSPPSPALESQKPLKVESFSGSSSPLLLAVSY